LGSVIRKGILLAAADSIQLMTDGISIASRRTPKIQYTSRERSSDIVAFAKRGEDGIGNALVLAFNESDAKFSLVAATARRSLSVISVHR
jgi:hypothetical protein